MTELQATQLFARPDSACIAQMRSCHRFPHLVQLKKRVMPSSVLAEKKTASLCWHASHVTSRVLGSVGSARTSCRMTVFSFEV